MLTINDLFDNAQKALDEKRLQFFSPMIEMEIDNYAKCRYRQGEYCCAVGASITDDQYSSIMESNSAWPVLKGIYRTSALHTQLLRTANRMQTYFDELVTAVGREDITREQAAQKFQTWLNENR